LERVGIIGAGKIGGSLIARLWEDFDLTVSDAYEEQLVRLARVYNIKTTLSNKEAAESSELLVIAVKPWDEIGRASCRDRVYVIV
jgi:pyrroline-5-carboxylate reductase